MFRVGVEAFVVEDLTAHRGDGEVAVVVVRDHVASKSPMANGGHHVLAYPQLRDGVFVGKRGAWHNAFNGLIDSFLQPHLTERERLMPREMGNDSVDRLFSPHEAF